ISPGPVWRSARIPCSSALSARTLSFAWGLPAHLLTGHADWRTWHLVRDLEERVEPLEPLAVPRIRRVGVLQALRKGIARRPHEGDPRAGLITEIAPGQ